MIGTIKLELHGLVVEANRFNDEKEIESIVLNWKVKYILQKQSYCITVLPDFMPSDLQFLTYAKYINDAYRKRKKNRNNGISRPRIEPRGDTALAKAKKDAEAERARYYGQLRTERKAI